MLSDFVLATKKCETYYMKPTCSPNLAMKEQDSPITISTDLFALYTSYTPAGDIPILDSL